MNLKFLSYPVIGLCILLSGCSTMQTRKAKQSGFLKDYSQLTSKGGKAQLHWLDPEVDFSKYNKVILNHVSLMTSRDADMNEADAKTKQALVDYLYAVLHKQLSENLEIVDTPGPDTMRIRVALTDMGKSKPVLNTVSTIIPIGLAISTVKKVVTDKPLSVGHASIEMEILDSTTKKRIAAAVDNRVGTKMPTLRQVDPWGHVKNACDWWAKTLAEQIAVQQEK